MAALFILWPRNVVALNIVFTGAAAILAIDDWNVQYWSGDGPRSINDNVIFLADDARSAVRASVGECWCKVNVIPFNSIVIICWYHMTIVFFWILDSSEMGRDRRSERRTCSRRENDSLLKSFSLEWTISSWFFFADITFCSNMYKTRLLRKHLRGHCVCGLCLCQLIVLTLWITYELYSSRSPFLFRTADVERWCCVKLGSNREYR